MVMLMLFDPSLLWRYFAIRALIARSAALLLPVVAVAICCCCQRYAAERQMLRGGAAGARCAIAAGER